MTKNQMSKLRNLKESELEKRYLELNGVIGKAKMYFKSSQKDVPVPKGTFGMYKRAKVERARVLTLLNQKRNERTMR